MAEQTAAQEPTMEEILASIRRIISEDEPGSGGPTKTAAESGGDVLELTDRIGSASLDDDADEFVPPPPAPTPPAPLAAPTRVETSGDLDIFSPPEPAPPPRRPTPPPPPPREPAMRDDDEPLISAPKAAHVSSAFGQLSLARNTPMPEAGRGLEEVVRELLTPLLRAWLDQHLPAIVEARVQAEVERLSRGG